MARRKVNMSGPDLKAFRRSVAELKKKGLVSKRVDARSQKPTRYMRKKVKDLDPILRGVQTGVKVKPDILRKYRDAGFKIVNRRVIVAKNPQEISRVRQGRISLIERLGRLEFEKVVLPIEPRSADQLLNDYRKNPEKYEDLKNSGERFAFRLLNRNSLGTFEDFELLLEQLLSYEIFQSHDDDETWEQIEFFRTAEYWPKSPPIKRPRMRSYDRREQTRKVYSPMYVPIEEKMRKERERKARWRSQNQEAREKEKARDRLYQVRKRERDKQARLDRENGWS